MGRRRYSGYNSRKRHSGANPAFLILLFWVVSGLVMLSFLHGGPGKLIQGKSDNVAKMYIGNVFPTVSRGSDSGSREVLGDSLSIGQEDVKQNLLSAKQSETLLQSMVGSMFPGVEAMDDDLAEEDPQVTLDTAQDTNPPDPVPENIDRSKPVVIIYHTHATESYQPVTEGNFHSLNESGTVREVGNVLAKELENKGIQVIHSKTIHDSPSYSQSYTRSLDTVQNLIGGDDSQKIIVDLHRDAAGYSGNNAKTVTINKNTLAGYALVIGSGNPNYEALKTFANHINKTAAEMYPGFEGKIIEKQYKFNQYVSDYHILLEVGNNENTIEQAKLTGKYFADVLAEAVKSIE
ncbi:MAG: stage II sporulation protein P [Eubacteriales bacterium]|nr:stage II sporulation protein P [Eubacteriales bacterium]MDD3199614.1 stage II sporulation protein P [Eubacteriales bacterium]MDD4122360.1 stage II sporulation protein P [Eubacteriales bacterium]MDD4629881.1 stage II sporulation protein P [Eubacteriales bacterium]